ncbi:MULTISPECIES: hypothetical protein [unclassified Streptomyces]|uniref:hypothetical protein n=1 Tax=unclassified Streptomyces TaxID=2593676 RepID=UPI002DD82A2B|nr:hypothetical protein [Streptomyces sp. NBC_01750]WSB04407.1 hypothetical protein OIE54_37265 [Streptomyces sp. NBC_01794]WSD31311.1 hypothetical protein OG966_04840 [Streptomyces sp. NBC_01750]
MSGYRPFFRRLPLILGVATAAYAVVVRPRTFRWGATSDEAARAFPGDDLIPYADGQSTMATTLPARPEELWRWLQQMGCNRAGWYSWDLLDHFGRPSAKKFVPEWQDVKEGQHLDTMPNGMTWFTAELVDPPRSLLLRADLKFPSGLPFDPLHWPPPKAYADGIWAFHLESATADSTRLVVRTRGRSTPRPLMRIVDLRQFRNLRTRLRTSASARTRESAGS